MERTNLELAVSNLNRKSGQVLGGFAVIAVQMAGMFERSPGAAVVALAILLQTFEVNIFATRETVVGNLL